MLQHESWVRVCYGLIAVLIGLTGGLGNALFTANRKARLWDQFCQLYAGIATEAEDDFHSLFGKAFAKAYDEQMERFRSGG